MCGRARFACSAEDVSAATGIPVNELDARWINKGLFTPVVNAMPAAWVPVVRVGDDGRRVVESMKWGLVPSFTKPEERPDHFRMFNARSETIASKSIFSRLLERRRCVVLVNGFYEWKELGNKTKQPYYVHLSGPKAAAEGGGGGGGAVGKGEGPMLRMAGLWDTWRDADGNKVHTCTMITVDSAPRLSWLHDRMPALLVTDADVAAWLEGGEGGSVNLKVIHPYNGDDLAWHPVTQSMSKPSYQGSDAWKDTRTAKGSIMNFFAKSPAKPKAAAAAGSGGGGGKAAGGGGRGGRPNAAGCSGADKAGAGAGGGSVKAEGGSGSAKQEVKQEGAAAPEKAEKAAAAAAAPAGEGGGSGAAVAVKAEQAAAAVSGSGRGQKRAADDEAAAGGGSVDGGGEGEEDGGAGKKPRSLPAGGVLNPL